MIKLLTALLLYTSQNAYANRAVMEVIPTSNGGVFIATTTPQLLLNGATFYSGGVSPVGLRSSSNVVVGADKCVIYSSGSIACVGTISGTNVTTSSGPFVLKTGDTMTGALTVTGTSVTANSFFGDGSHLTGIKLPFSFISSNTVSGSTATVKNVVTVFSTYSYSANGLSVGGRIRFECAYQNGTIAPGTPIVGLYLNGTAIMTGANTGALNDTIVYTDATLTQSGKIVYIGTFLVEQSGSTSVWSNATPIGNMEQNFDETSAQTFNCSGSRATGGAINFMWMRVTYL